MDKLTDNQKESSDKIALGAIASRRAFASVWLDRVAWERAYRAAGEGLALELERRAALLPAPPVELAARLAAWREERRAIGRQEEIRAGVRELTPGTAGISPQELAERLDALKREGRELEKLHQQEESAGAGERESLLGLASSIRRRALSLGYCGSVASYRACNACGAGREGSGVLGPGGRFFCQTRVCPVCATYRSAKISRRLQATMQEIDLVKDYALSHITFTIKYDPENIAEFDFQTMRDKVQGLLRAIRGAWNPVRAYGRKHSKVGLRKVGEDKRANSGLFVKFEISDSGNIHCHALYYGPYIVKEQIEALLSRGYDRAGFVKIRRVASNPELALWRELLKKEGDLSPVEEGIKERIAGSIREIAKYVTKSPSPLDEGYIRGERRFRLHPLLAVCWEAALHRQPALASYGVFRGIEEATPEEGYQDEKAALELDSALPCVDCGCQAGYSWEATAAHRWVLDCERRGLLAFRRSRRRGRDGPNVDVTNSARGQGLRYGRVAP